jgi:hypothetical protein
MNQTAQTLVKPYSTLATTLAQNGKSLYQTLYTASYDVANTGFKRHSPTEVLEAALTRQKTIQHQVLEASRQNTEACFNFWRELYAGLVQVKLTPQSMLASASFEKVIRDQEASIQEAVSSVKATAEALSAPVTKAVTAARSRKKANAA